MAKPGVEGIVKVAGAGPAGLCLAVELAERGVPVEVFDPAFGEPWRASYGLWSRGLIGSRLAGAISGKYETASCRVGDSQIVLNESYVRLDTPTLQYLLVERARSLGVRFISHRVPKGVSSPDLLVLATGSQVEGAPCFQSAFGVWIDERDVPKNIWDKVVSSDVELMDYTAVDVALSGPPSFMYSMVETIHGRRRWFVQETVLVSGQRCEERLLRARLVARLFRRGYRLSDDVLRSSTVERCSIPMGILPTRPSSGTLTFGAAAGLVHPATGYQFSHMLSLAPIVAEAITLSYASGGRWVERASAEAWELMWPTEKRRSWELYHWGALVLCQFDGPQMRSFVRTFFSLPRALWLGFLEGTLEPSAILKVMWAIFAESSELRGSLLKSGVLCAPQFVKGVFAKVPSGQVPSRLSHETVSALGEQP